MSSQKSVSLLFRAVPLSACLCLLISAPAAAFHLPKWELGLGAGVLHMPAYRGALGRENIWLPVPYVAYRGERFKADEEGLRSTLVERERFVLDFSLAGNLPVSASDGAREGMVDLDPIGEIGPSLDIALGRHGERHLGWEQQWWLRLPLRAALSVGEPWVAHRGWVFSPYLNWVWIKTGEAARWGWNLSAGPIFASRAYHDYFYRVGADDVTATRPAYAATAGYSGQRVSLALSMNSRKWFVGGFVRYDDLHGATFEDSPLVETRGYLVLGVAVSRIFLQSERYAPH